MRRKVKQRLSRREPGRAVRQYRSGGTLSPEQEANLRYRGDRFAPRDGKLVAAFDSDDERRLAWEEHGHRFMHCTVPGRRPKAYWQYTPDVPDELRSSRAWWNARYAQRYPHLSPWLSCPEAVVVSHELRVAQDRWLLDHGNLRPGEREALTRTLRRARNDGGSFEESVARLRTVMGG